MQSKCKWVSESVESVPEVWCSGDQLKGSFIRAVLQRLIAGKYRMSQRIRGSQKIRTDFQRTVWGQAEQFSEKPREARLNQSAWRVVWARTAELNQPARVQKDLERVSLFSSKSLRWQLSLANLSYFYNAVTLPSMVLLCHLTPYMENRETVAHKGTLLSVVLSIHCIFRLSVTHDNQVQLCLH